MASFPFPVDSNSKELAHKKTDRHEASSQFIDLAFTIEQREMALIELLEAAQ